MDPKSWSNYFVNVSRDVPLPALSAVCNELGVSLSEVIRRAERAEAQPVPSLTGLADALAADVGDPDLDALREQKRNRKAR